MTGAAQGPLQRLAILYTALVSEVAAYVRAARLTNSLRLTSAERFDRHRDCRAAKSPAFAAI
jgi:hypothetical protein